jgi:hypothetical protein
MLSILFSKLFQVSVLIRFVFIIFILSVFKMWYNRLNIYGKELYLLLKDYKSYVKSYLNYVQFIIFIMYFVIGFPVYYFSLLIFMIFY